MVITNEVIELTPFHDWITMECYAHGRLGFYSLSFTRLSHLTYDRILMHLQMVVAAGAS